MFTVSRKHFDIDIPQPTQEYTELEYIEGNGSVFNTLYNPSNNTKMSMDIMPIEYCGEIVDCYIGFGGNTFGHDNNDYRIIARNDVGTFFDIGNKRIQQSSLILQQNNWYKIICENGKMTVNDTEYTGSINTASIYSAPIKIFNTEEYPVNFKIAYLKIYESNVLVKDIIPVKDNNNVPCLYEKISDTYLYSTNSNVPIAGPEVNSVVQTSNISFNGYLSMTKFLTSKENSNLSVLYTFEVGEAQSISFNSRKYKIGSKIDLLPTTTPKTDYRFKNWVDNSNTIITTNSNANGIYTIASPDFVQLKYMTFDCDGGTLPSGEQIKQYKFAPTFPFSEYTFPSDPSKTDMRFKGWFTGKEGTGQQITSSSICPNIETTYFAKWAEATGGYVYYCGNYGDFHETEDIIGEITNYNQQTRTIDVQFNGSSHINGYSDTGTFDFNNQECYPGYGYQWEQNGEYTVNWYGVEGYDDFDIYIKMGV